MRARYAILLLFCVHFRGDPASSAKAINNWVKENTNQKITEIIRPEAIDAHTSILIVNAVYFKGTWLKTFSKYKTQESANFYISADETIQVPLMSMTEMRFMHGSNKELKCDAIELPYVNNQFSMYIILPDTDTTDLKKVESILTQEHLTNVKESFQMSGKELNVFIPRFKLDLSPNLSDTLVRMGIGDLFAKGLADLSGMDGTKELVVSKAVQRAYVEVNEEGIEAAAVTTFSCSITCVRPHIPITIFRADHPFLFFIQGNVTRSILFLGRLVNPR